MSEGPRRIREQRQVAKGDDAALAALLGGALRVGTMQGVRIDFRHPMLPQGEWEALPWWYVWGPTPDWSGIIFPGEAAFELEELRKTSPLRNGLPAKYARSGDLVTITGVEVIEGRSRFDHPHDREIRLASLRIERPSGEVEVAGPLAFYGTGAVIDHPTREAFDHIIHRILGHAGLDDFPPSVLLPANGDYWGLTIEQAAVQFASEAHREFFELYDAMPQDGSGRLDRAQLRILANSAVLAGFLLAKIEGGIADARANRGVETAQIAAAARRNDELIETGRGIAAAHPAWKRNRIAKELLKSFPEKELSSINRTLRTQKVGPEPR